MKTPLLPINAILCPHGRIPLQIFETRYLDMVSDCLKEDKGFVAVLLREERGGEAFYQFGTLAKIVDFGSSEINGILTVTAEGLYQVVLSDIEKQDDGLWLANVSQQKMEDPIELPEEYDELKAVLKALVRHPFVKELNMNIDYEDCRHIGWRLTELLPLGNHQKQSLYEMHDPILRLEKISEKLSRMVD